MENASDDFPQQKKLENLLPNFAGRLLLSFMGRARCCVWAQTRPLGVLWQRLGYFSVQIAIAMGKPSESTSTKIYMFSPHALVRQDLFCGGWLVAKILKCETVLRDRNIQEEILGSLSVDCIKTLGSPRKWLVNPRKSSEVLGSSQKSSEVLGSPRKSLGNRAPNSISRLGIQRFQSFSACVLLLCCTIIQKLGSCGVPPRLTRFQGTR